MQAQELHQTSQPPRVLRNTRKPDPLIEASVQFGSKLRPTEKQVNIFKELFFNLIFKADASAKRKLSTALARSHYTPRTIAIFFSMEEIEISAPMLLFSPVLRERDLNAVIEKTTISHLRVIARRTSLETSTVRKLLSRDDDQELVRKLLKKNASLQQNQEAIDLLSLPSSAFQIETPEEVGAEQPTIRTEDDFDQPEAKPTHQKLFEIANIGGRLARKRHSTVQSYVGSSELFEKQLLECARKGNHASFAQTVENACALDASAIVDIIERQDAGMLASLLRAMHISKTVSCQILLLLNRDIGRNVTVFRAVSQKFDELRRSECQAIFERLGAQFTDRAATPAEQPLAEDFNKVLHNRRDSIIPHRQQTAELMYGTL